MTTKDAVLVREIFQLLVRKFGLLQKEGAQCCGISPVMSHVLYEINKRPGISLNELAEALALDNSTTSRHVQGLVKDNLVLSQPSTQDRRFLVLSLSPAGKEKAQEIDQLMVTYINGVLEHVPTEKREQVIESIAILLQALQQTSGCCN